ncbi:uncharacterized protein LOC123036946 [Drosophila rhopaloa]|uniref:Uncharacterized protein n=1 Tax=Drosophila rhopaloa TaxID=1041015 RepID=A0ABM5J0T2_DRORH|nr:uncharacterized protein LOC123036946 [Drosophila rhopaloa]
MKFSIFILTVFALYQTRVTTAVKEKDGEESISSVIRDYGETLENFYKNRTFEFEDDTLKHSVPLPTQLSLKTIANNLLFIRERIDRFCNVTRDTRSIDENSKLSFLTDIKEYLTAMRQSIFTVPPFHFLQTTTGEFLRHIDDALKKVSSVTANSREAILQACDEQQTTANNDNSNSFSPVENEAVHPSPCVLNKLSKRNKKMCLRTCQVCSLQLCKSTLSDFVDMGSNLLQSELRNVYNKFLASIRDNQNEDCVNIFLSFLLDRRPMLTETLEKMTSDQLVIFTILAASPYKVTTRFVKI